MPRVQHLLEQLKLKEDRDVRDDLHRTLLQVAYYASKKTYSPYSNFPVGAALLDRSGRVFTGCNVENASYGGVICAERTAIVKAVSEGSLEYELIAVVCQKTKDAWPCGICRQFISEFGRDIKVIAEGLDGEILVMSVSDLLPKMFGPHQLPH
ncbi:MAG: cytidine deaminase [Candidatus Obscuribacterales bacterium]|nr:cytidine deaminase [Candidatus Obscuribacterales bacterium]